MFKLNRSARKSQNQDNQVQLNLNKDEGALLADQQNYEHWKIAVDAKAIICLSLDRSDSTTNTLNRAVLIEFKDILQKIYTLSSSFSGLVIQSGKKNGFLAGADLYQFNGVNSSDEALEIIQEGQNAFDLLESLPIPTLAYINGFCIGGGLELALACRYRVAVEQPKTKLGLPEVLLGLHPGWGGMVRLPKLIGAPKAMELILSGRTVNARTAAKIGLVDASVPLRVAQFAIEAFMDKKPKPRREKLMNKISNATWVRPLLGKYLLKQVTQRVNRAHYPAPFAAIEQWVTYGVDASTAYAHEAKSMSQLMLTDTARNLVRVFLLQDMLKSFGKTDHLSLLEKNNLVNTASKPILVHVVGGGLMGGDIAAWCAMKGFRVTVEDPNPQALASTFKRALELFTKQIKVPFLIQAARDRLLPDMAGFGAKNADIIIEAIIEKKAEKQALFKRLEAIAKPEAIFATNTSTIPLDELNADLENPGRLVGLHFFNPVSRMPLVEVVSDVNTDADVAKKMIKFALKLDKLPLPVESAPGFLVNRILMPYLLEAILMVEEGIPPAAIDKAAREFGMPMGPLELLDTVGIDVALFATESLKAHFPDVTIPKLAKHFVTEGRLGKKTGRGFYRYKNGKMLPEKVNPNYRLPEDTLDRLILRMVNESVASLREGIVKSADLVDAGMIFGTGFPPFRGGPMHYAAEQGEPLLIQRLNLLAQRYGNRFIPDAGWG